MLLLEGINTRMALNLQRGSFYVKRLAFVLSLDESDILPFIKILSGNISLAMREATCYRKPHVEKVL